MNKSIELKLAKSLRVAVSAGHPWIYGTALAALPDAPSGTVARVVDRQGFVCWGIYESGHPIAVRVWSRDENDYPDDTSVATRLARAAKLRRRLIAPEVEAYRLLHAEADGCPGWAIDRYRDILVVRTDGEAAVARLPVLLEALAVVSELQPYTTIVHRRSRGDAGPVSQVLFGPTPEVIACREYAWTMEADVLQGQKTGWFVDQRENRRLIFDVAGGLRVANLFSYTGGFSLAAALGGAAAVCSVDISQPAIAAAKRNFELNGLSVGDYEFVAEDAFAWLANVHNEGRQFDVIVVDPPSFAPNRRSVPNAERAYGKLFTGALTLLAPCGFLAASSCSSHITHDMFRDIVARAAGRSGRDLSFLVDRGAGPDHPVLPAFPEGRYLKFLLCHVL